MSDDVRVSELPVHIDTLKYTREGLQTHEPFALELGALNRVVLIRPTRRRSLAQGARGFPRDSSYPLPATLSLTWSLATVGTAFTHHTKQTEHGGKVFQVFAHASESGDEDHNKALSERRGEVGRALLLGDPDALRAVADDDGWGLREHQAMLRTLACDPGPTDGDSGDHTTAAVELFQGRYNDGVYHRRHSRAPNDTLEVDGDLGDLTKAALFEAFVHAHGAGLEDAELHPSFPVSGCSEFNALSKEDMSLNRRLAIIAHPSLPEHSEAAPCIAGDAQACAVVDDEPARCMFYREHVTERPSAPVMFRDLRWKWLGDDRYLLSALTNFDGDCDVVFDVFNAVERVHGAAEVESPWIEEPLAESLEGEVLRGIAQVVWRSGLDVLDARGEPDLEHFPTFRVRDPSGEAFALCPWPELQTLRVLVGAIGIEDHTFKYRLEANDGSYSAEVSISEATPVTGSHVAIEFEDVPVDARVSLWVAADEGDFMQILSNVVAHTMEDNCARGEKCVEVPLPVPPPEEALLDDDDEFDPDDDGDVVDVLHDVDHEEDDQPEADEG